MDLPRFDLEEALSDRAKYIGELPWLGAQSVQIQAIAPQRDEPGRAIVATGGQHGAKAGDKVFVAGYGPTIDHFYEVGNHPDAKHRKTAFSIQLSIKDRLGTGILYKPQVFQMLHPKHLSMESSIEMKSLELRHLEVLQAISPQNYRKTMILLLKGLSGEGSADTLKGDIENLIGKIGGDSNEGEEIKPEAIARIQTIELEIMMREIEIICSMPKGHMQAMAQKPGMEDVVKQIHEFVSALIKQSDEDKTPGESAAQSSKKPPRSRKESDTSGITAKAS